jgi:hypothetical protein
VSQVRDLDGFAQYQISCPISAGNRGGPVLNERGQVIGIVSWTKADAQNLSFAVPCREAARLKADRTVSPWEQPSWPVQVSSVAPATNTEVAVSAEQKDISLSGSLAEFNRRLAEAAGKKVTVIFQQEGREQKFNFTVPPGLKMK